MTGTNWSNSTIQEREVIHAGVAPPNPSCFPSMVEHGSNRQNGAEEPHQELLASGRSGECGGRKKGASGGFRRRLFTSPDTGPYLCVTSRQHLILIHDHDVFNLSQLIRVKISSWCSTSFFNVHLCVWYDQSGSGLGNPWSIKVSAIRLSFHHRCPMLSLFSECVQCENLRCGGRFLCCPADWCGSRDLHCGRQSLIIPRFSPGLDFRFDMSAQTTAFRQATTRPR
jgi:hypothetical protein